jgi:hypothetical protein
MSESKNVSLHRHPHPHREFARRWRHYAAQQEFRVSILTSVLLFIASVVVSLFAIQYATERASNSVTDIFLSNVPVVDVDGLFVYGTLSLIVFIALLLIAHPKRIPFALHGMTLLFFIRSAFISMTHIGPFPLQTADTGWNALVNHFIFSSDLFFSGHTAVPFLMALMFWQEKNLRYIFLAWSVFMGVVVLLGHLHYSIDVVAAFFITYSIFHMAQWLFPRDFKLFNSDLLASAI